METFTSMPNEARTWIYAANRPLSSAEQNSITTELNTFVRSWTAHENPLKAEAAILYNRFVVIMVDEGYNQISGCGIDKSVQLIKVLNEKYNLDFFNRMLVHILNNDQIETYSRTTLQDAVNTGLVNEQSVTFNHLIQTKKDFLSNWKQPLPENWVSKQIKFLVQA